MSLKSHKYKEPYIQELSSYFSLLEYTTWHPFDIFSKHLNQNGCHKLPGTPCSTEGGMFYSDVVRLLKNPFFSLSVFSHMV